MKDKCAITFTGDIGFDKYMERKWEDPELLSKELLNFITDGDHVIANVEGALIDAKDNGSHGVFFHAINPEAVSLLSKIKADIWTIANNHIMDAGTKGLMNTLKLANDMNCQTVGAGLNIDKASKPIYLDEAGGIGIFSVAYMKECIPADEDKAGVFPWNSDELIEKRIKEIKRNCRWCIVISHGGEEFADIPNPYTRERYLNYLKMGADIVVGHHPHVVENYELFKDKAIFYSLGNFIFDTDYQRVHLYTDQGVILKLILDEDHFEFKAIGTKINRNNEHIDIDVLPDIFTDINEEEYQKLIPLAADSFIKEEIKKMIYLDKKRFLNASKEEWEAYFNSEEPDGYDKGKHMDLSIIKSMAEKAAVNEWFTSKLQDVVAYIKKRGEH